MARIMGEPFYGTGKAPDEYKPGDYVEYEFSGYWFRIFDPVWFPGGQYRIEARGPHYLPPIWCLDRAAQLAGRGGWGDGDFGSQRLKKSIIAHARTLRNGCEPMQEPVDPLVETIKSHCEEDGMSTFEAIAASIRARFDITPK